ncbi:MAG TPA: hypothetical protein PLD20_32220, partial [Blastocatellia bacterium]|nr:hypothetical protein [Blastocatellia bacterium]
MTIEKPRAEEFCRCLSNFPLLQTCRPVSVPSHIQRGRKDSGLCQDRCRIAHTVRNKTGFLPKQDNRKADLRICLLVRSYFLPLGNSITFQTIKALSCLSTRTVCRSCLCLNSKPGLFQQLANFFIGGLTEIFIPA